MELPSGMEGLEGAVLTEVYRWNGVTCRPPTLDDLAMSLALGRQDAERVDVRSACDVLERRGLVERIRRADATDNPAYEITPLGIASLSSIRGWSHDERHPFVRDEGATMSPAVDRSPGAERGDRSFTGSTR